MSLLHDLRVLGTVFAIFAFIALVLAAVGLYPVMADYPYGERQYTVVDSGGHCWTFSQSIGASILRTGTARQANCWSDSPVTEV